MMSSLSDRLFQEEKSIKENDNFKQIGGQLHKIFKDEDDCPHWLLSILGPKYTPYEGGRFTIEIKFPKDYPNSAPEIQMRTITYHPNIDKDNGNICLPYIYHWENYFDITGLIFSVFDLLAHPNSKNAYCTLDEEKARKFTFFYADNSSFDWNSDFYIRRWNLGW